MSYCDQCAKLLQENEHLRARVTELQGQHKGLVMNNAMLRQRHDLPADRIPAAAAYEAEIERLRAALRPFANFCIDIDATEAGRLAPASQMIHAGLTVGAFRNAAAALGEPTPQPMEKVKDGGGYTS